MTLDKILDRLEDAFSGVRALDAAADLARHHRIQGSPGYDEAIKALQERVDSLGLPTKLHAYPADGRSKTYEWFAPPGWTVRFSQLEQRAPSQEILATSDEIPQLVVAHSPGGSFEAGVVHVGRGTQDDDYQGHDLRGKVALAYGRASDVVKRAARHGAVAAVVYPDSERAAASHDLVRYEAIFPRADEVSSLVPAMSISRRTADRLLRALEKTEVILRGSVDAQFIDEHLRVLEAWIPGHGVEGEILVVAHACHPKPSANDNASGSAVLFELARALREVGSDLGAWPTVRFLWVPEFYGTLPWAAAHQEMLERVRFVLNLDMVGQSPDEIGTPLMLFRAPNHTPHYLNALLDPLADRVARRGIVSAHGSRRPLHWLLEPPSGGSDHLVFSASPHRIPAVMFGHDDPYWHTDLDTIDKVDATRLKQVGILVGALCLAPAWMRQDPETVWGWLLDYGVRQLTRAASLARDVEAGAGRALLQAAFDIECTSALQFAREIAPGASEDDLNRHQTVMQAVHGRLLQALPAAEGRSLEGSHPHRVIDGPLVYAITDRFDDDDLQFFKEKLSDRHRALVESLLNLCDGTRSVTEIALRCSLDAGRWVPVEDVERAVTLLSKVGYLKADA